MSSCLSAHAPQLTTQQFMTRQLEVLPLQTTPFAYKLICMPWCCNVTVWLSSCMLRPCYVSRGLLLHHNGGPPYIADIAHHKFARCIAVFCCVSPAVNCEAAFMVWAGNGLPACLQHHRVPHCRFDVPALTCCLLTPFVTVAVEHAACFWEV